MDAMYGTLADSIGRGLARDFALSALPDAPVRTERTRPPRGRAPAARLRRRSANLLVGLAGRLDPDAQLS
jgi:hypothetical protein